MYLRLSEKATILFLINSQVRYHYAISRYLAGRAGIEPTYLVRVGPCRPGAKTLCDVVQN